MPAWATEIPYQLMLSAQASPSSQSTPVDPSPEIPPKSRLGGPTGSHIIYIWTQTLKNKTTGRPQSTSLAHRRSARLGAGVGPWLPSPQVLKALPVMLGVSTGDPRNAGRWRSFLEEAPSCSGPGGLEQYVEFPNLACRNRFV